MAVDLPDEVLNHIFSYLDTRSLGLALQCSTSFYRIATAPALWELPYLLRWSTGDSQREVDRGTNAWRRYKRLQRLQEHARRAAVEMDLPSATWSESPFRHLQLDPRSTPSATLPTKLDFYRLFIERIHIDQRVIDTLYQQVEATHGRIPAITSLALRFGNDAKDVLAAIVESQSSCPSWSGNGLPSATAAVAFQEAGSRATRKDPLAHNSHSYHLNAYQAHLPTTLRSETHHLVILHHAREILEHLQRREAMQRMNEVFQFTAHAPKPAESHPPTANASSHFVPSHTETAVSLLTMFRGGEVTYVESQLDILAAACDLYLQQRFPAWCEPKLDHTTKLERAEGLSMAICDFLADHGFRGPRGDLFNDLDNHFLHYCLTTNRETLPLSLTLIFCAISNRLGLCASLCNFPMHILAVVMADPSAPLPGPTDTLSSAPQELFWFDVCEYTTAASDAHKPTATDAFARRASWLQQRPPILDRADLTERISQMGIPPTDDFWRPAQPDTMVQRAARNILDSVQRAQMSIGHVTFTFSNVDFGRRSSRLELQWSRLVRVDYAFISSFYGRTDPAEHEAITHRVAAALKPSNTDRETCVAKDETTWRIIRTWRAESMRDLKSDIVSWAMRAQTPAKRFRQWMEQRAHDNDWSRARLNLIRRADHWSEHELRAAKYAAANAFLRLSTHINAREVDWIAGFLQNHFMLDVEVIERDFLGVSQSDTENGMDEDDASSDGSNSCAETGFSIRAARDGTPPQERAMGIFTNPSVRVILGRMLQAVRANDGEAPRVNRRAGAEARRNRQLRASIEPSTVTVEENEQDGEENFVGYRVGTIFRHRTYRYAGTILGWDPNCAAPEHWIVNMGVDRLPAPPQPARRPASSSPVDASSSRPRRGGRHQPFFHSQIADGTQRYVAEVNVEPIPGPIWAYGTPRSETRFGNKRRFMEEEKTLNSSLHVMLEVRGLGEYFRCFDQVRGRFRRNRNMREMFPDDYSDDDDDQV